MLPVVPMVQERRREVGCQWESPEEERREVGCQSDSVGRRDAAVQVDLLTQQLGWRHCPDVCVYGVARQCVSVKADEPGGGALLRPCSTHRMHTPDTGQLMYHCPPLYLLCCPLVHTQLPTMPLSGPPAPPPSQQHESKEPPQTASLPSTPLYDLLPPLLPADDLAPPPPAGLIAPLSPCLAEEDEKDGVKVEETQQLGRLRRKTAGPPIRYLLESEGQSHGPLSNYSKARTAEERMILGRLRREHQKAKEEDEFEDKETEDDDEEDGFRPVKMEERQQVGRPRRKTVGPPIRYLLESEGQSHGLLISNHSKARGAKEKIKLESLRKKEEEDEDEMEDEDEDEMEEEEDEDEMEEEEDEDEMEDEDEDEMEEEIEKEEEEEEEMEEKEEDGLSHFKMEERQQVGRPRRKTVIPPIRYLLESEGQSHGLLISNHSKARGAKEKIKLESLRKEDEDEMEEEEHEDEIEEEEEEEEEEEMEEKEDGFRPVKMEETQQVGRPRRKTVGPPIRYLLESEGQSHGLLISNHSRARGAKEKIKLESLRKKEEDEEEDEDEMEDEDEDEMEEEEDEDEMEEEEDEDEMEEEEDEDEMEDEDEDEMEEEIEKEEEEEEEMEEKEEDGLSHFKMEETQQVGRPRRKTVIPPIRYLLESEGQSHGLFAANHSKARGAKEKIKLEHLRKEDEDEMEEEEHEDEIEEEEEEEEEEEMEEKEDGFRPVKMEETQQVGRPRRKTVGPPIRYLLESEGQSHGLLISNHSKARGAKNMKMWRLKKEEKDSERVPAVKKRRESQWSARTTNHIAGRVQSNATHLKRKMDDDEKSLSDCHQDISQSEVRSFNQKIRSETQQGQTWQRCRKRSSKTGAAAAPSQHARAEGGENMVVKKKKEEEEGGQKRRWTEEQREDESMVKEDRKTRVLEQAGRLRRKMVGPPIRYLLESESWSHGQSTANLCKARGVKEQESEAEEEKEERSGEVELKEWTDSSGVDSSEDEGVGGGLHLCQVCGLIFTCRSSLQLHLSVHRTPCWLHHRRAADDKQDEEVDTNSDRERRERTERCKEEEKKTLLPAPTRPPGWLKSTKRVHRNPWWWVNYRTIMWRRQDEKRWRRQQEVDGGKGKKRGSCREKEKEGGGKEKGRQTEVVEQPQRLRRNMVGPPIRYLLESEETSHGPVIANRNRWRVFKQRKKAQESNAGGGVSADTAIIDRSDDTKLTVNRQTSGTVKERQTGRTNQERVNRSKGRPNKVMTDSEAEDWASGMTDRSMAAERQPGHMVTERKKTLLPASTKASDWSRCITFGSKNPCWWFDHPTTMMRRRQEADRWRKQEYDGDRWKKRRRFGKEGEEEKPVCVKEKGERTRRDEGEGKVRQMEVKKEVVEQPQRPRRKMVGPPVRYLLESEEQSHGPVIQSDQSKVRLYKQDVKTQKKKNAGGGASDRTAMTDRSEDTKQTDRQACETVTARQTGHMVLYKQTHLVYNDLQSSQVTVISPCCVRLQRL